MFETFEHTADLGLRARAASLDELFVEMARALFAAILDNPASVRPVQEVALHIAGSDRELLLHDWLRELLFLFDARHLLFSEFEVRLTDQGLEGKARGEPLDRQRHELAHEIKAITYHGLTVHPDNGGWLAEVIVDI